MLKPTDLNGGCGLLVCYARLFTIVQAEWDQNKCPLYGMAGCPLLESMEIQSRHSELSAILQVSAVEGCWLSGVPLSMPLGVTEVLSCTVK